MNLYSPEKAAALARYEMSRTGVRHVVRYTTGWRGDAPVRGFTVVLDGAPVRTVDGRNFFPVR